MPINYKEYHPKWKKISHFIRFYRAKNCCEWCGVPNYQLGHRVNGEWISTDRAIQHLKNTGVDLYESIPLDKKFTKIILTVAHIDHNKNNNSFFNLAALCQGCHLNHDRHQHARNRKYGRNPNQISIPL